MSLKLSEASAIVVAAFFIGVVASLIFDWAAVAR